MRVFCPVLSSGKYIPAKYAGKEIPGGQNISLPISWSDIPAGTKAFALSMIDRHPAAENRIHWLVVNLPASARGVAENASGIMQKMPPGCVELRNSYGENRYGGPRPSRGSGAHEYVVTVYALRDELRLGPLSTYEEFKTDVGRKQLAMASVTGLLEQ
jgi:hypothetical protein